VDVDAERDVNEVADADGGNDGVDDDVRGADVDTSAVMVSLSDCKRAVEREIDWELVPLIAIDTAAEAGTE
jgi:hypothetical protein